MKLTCPHCGFDGDFDHEECPACLQDMLSSMLNHKAIYDRVFDLQDKVEELEEELKKPKPLERVTIPIAVNRIAWLTLPKDCTRQEKNKLLAILKALTEFQEQDEREKLTATECPVAG